MVSCYIKDYPRPQLVRKDWQNLNGKWDFKFDDENNGVSQNLHLGFEGQAIQVPFTYETELSGIGDPSHHSCVWYSRAVVIPGDKLSSVALLHFEGSDYRTTVWVNGCCAGEHEGGYSRFSFPIQGYIKAGVNNIAVRCEDSVSTSQPRGKQRWMDDNYGCWYVQTTGIWKTVWLEFLSDTHLRDVKITPYLDDASVEFEYHVSANCGITCSVESEIAFNGHIVSTQRTSLENFRQTVRVSVSSDKLAWRVPMWSPDEPNLFDVIFRVYMNGELVDEAGSYFGMRKIEISGNNVMLNNSPIYQRLILDQGYWRKSGLTPPSEDALIEDIDKILQLGFNGLRKHQKVEDERFLFWCDVKGMLVWSEAAATYRYDDDAVQSFTKEWIEIVRQYYNHPSIIIWTPFNESWGVPNIKDNVKQQSFTASIYHLTKALDANRPVITNDGWEHTCSDIITLHDYEQDAVKFNDIYKLDGAMLSNGIPMTNQRFAFANGWEYEGQPVIISEYGGIAISGQGEGWGYGNKAADAQGLIKRYEALTAAIQKLPYICGFCYTQVTDVAQEVNGLMDIDRSFKCDPEAIRAINLKKTGR